MIEDDLPTKNLSSDLGMDEENKCKDKGQKLITDDKYDGISQQMAIIDDTNSGEIKILCDLCIDNKYTKIVRQQKTTPTTRRLLEIHANLWGPQDLFLLSEKIYVSLLLVKFI